MSDKYQRSSAELERALAVLEDRLETPFVPGELDEWCKETQEAFETLRELYRVEVRPAHERQLAEIREQDPGLDTRVARMAEEDEALVVELQRLGSLLSVLSGKVDPKVEETDDSGTEEELPHLIRQMLEVVIRIRMLEKSLQTWFIEAFERDQGVAD